MPVTVNYNNIDTDSDGATFASDVKGEIQATQTDLGKMSEKTEAETISGNKTHTGTFERSNAFFSAYSTQTDVVADEGAYTDIEWATPDREDSLYTLVTGDIEIEVSEAGDYKISYDGSTDNTQTTSGDRYTTEFTLWKKPSAGSFSEVTGTKSYAYNRNADDGEGTSSMTGRIFTLAANDRLKLRATVHTSGDSFGDIVLISGGTRILIERV